MVTADHYEKKPKKTKKRETRYHTDDYIPRYEKMIDLPAAKFWGGFCFPIIISLSNCQATR